MDADVLARWVTRDAEHVAEARQRLKARLHRLDMPRGLVDEAELMVSELTTNALTHGAVPLSLLVWRSELECVVVEVHDADGARPVLPALIDPGEVDPLAVAGRGLPLVTEMAQRRCGAVGLPGGGKSMWFALPLGHRLPSPLTMAALVKLRVWGRHAQAAYRPVRLPALS